MSGTVPKLEVRSPTLFTGRAVIASSLYGLILLIPVLVSMLIATMFQYGVITFVIPLGTIALVTFFLPLGFGNPYICRLVRPLRRPASGTEEVFVVQLTRNPRLRSGLGGLLEDADDIGLLNLTESALIFDGDAVGLTVPYEKIRELKQQSAGARTLFAYGRHTSFVVADSPDAGSFTFAERSSWFLPGSWRNAQRLYRALEAKTKASSGEGSTRPGLDIGEPV